MKNKVIKVIKKETGEAKPPPVVKAAAAERSRKKKQRNVESTVQGWITERRENDDAETRTRNSQLDAWNSDNIPTDIV